MTVEREAELHNDVQRRMAAVLKRGGRILKVWQCARKPPKSDRHLRTVKRNTKLARRKSVLG